MSRQPRTRRRKGIRVELTERDRDLLQALSRFRLARTAQLCCYAFHGIRRDTAMSRLRRLFDARLITVLSTGVVSENLYRLGPLGRQVLQGDGVRVGAAPRGGIEHHLGVIEQWVALATNPSLELARCLPDWELREGLRLGELAIIPDLFALVRLDGCLVPLAIEVDCGTESVSVLRSKVERYAALWGRSPGLFGWERFALLLVLQAPHRRAIATAALKNVWVLPHAILTAQDSLISALRQLLPQLQAPLAPSPEGSGSRQGEAVHAEQSGD